MGPNFLYNISRWSFVCLNSPRLSTGHLRVKRGLSTEESKVQNDIKEEPNQQEDEIKKKILEASLPFVLEHGWSKTAISAGAETLGYPGVIHGMFPRGGFELINHFYQTSNETLAVSLKAKALSSDKDPTLKKSEKEFAVEAVEERLKMIVPYIDTWPQALAIMTLPPNVPTALASLLTLVDDICYYAGDRSVDMGWYGKRIALAGVYKATELYMLQDRSEEKKASWEFLRRRMDEVTQLHAYVAQSEQASQFAKEFASAAFTTARNILGLHWNR